MALGTNDVGALLRRNKTAAAVLAVVLLVVGITVAVRGGDDATVSAERSELDAGAGRADGSDAPDDTADGAEVSSGPDGQAGAATPGGTPEAGTSPGDAGAARAGSATGNAVDAPASAEGARTPVPGVTDEAIKVVYYWKGDRTRTSPYLSGTGSESVVDEAEAFRKLVDFINAHDGDGTTFMGHPIELHGRKIEGIVLDAGQDPESYAATAQRITEEIRPFAAVAAHGSISSYLCPALAEAGIHNIGTYDLTGALASSTGGHCIPAGMTWERQVELTEGYLLREQRKDPDRVHGIVYAEYPGLVDAAPRMVERFRAAGIRIGEVASMSASLSTAQQQASNVVARMRAAGVDTIVMPDAGAPLSFTNAAQAQGYDPDYYVWPCSGQDTMGMVRLFNVAQWAGARGLSCYDEQYTSDLTISSAMRETEWYAAYREVAPRSEPPAPTPFVYAALLPLVVGLEGAGPDLHLESFRRALDRFTPYRYDAVEGRTDDPRNLLLDLGTGDRDAIADAIEVRYEQSRREPGSAAPGWYAYLGDRRYRTRADVVG